MKACSLMGNNKLYSVCEPKGQGNLSSGKHGTYCHHLTHIQLIDCIMCTAHAINRSVPLPPATFCQHAILMPASQVKVPGNMGLVVFCLFYTGSHPLVSLLVHTWLVMVYSS